jgi:hypothetical protein
MAVLVIPTATPPPCVRCRATRRANWNGRLPGAGALAGRPPTPADYYVRAKGTLGLFRHLCRGCRTATGDVPVAKFVPC